MTTLSPGGSIIESIELETISIYNVQPGASRGTKVIISGGIIGITSVSSPSGSISSSSMTVPGVSNPPVVNVTANTTLTSSMSGSLLVATTSLTVALPSSPASLCFGTLGFVCDVYNVSSGLVVLQGAWLTAQAAPVIPPNGRGRLMVAPTIRGTYALYDGPLSALDGISAAGTNQSTATLLTTNYNTITTCPNGAAVLLPSNFSLCRVENATATLLLVYPPLNGQIESYGVNNPVEIGSGSVVTFIVSLSGVWRTF